MGMAFGLEKKACNESNIDLAKTMVPKALEPYVTGKVILFYLTINYKHAHACSQPDYLTYYSNNLFELHTIIHVIINVLEISPKTTLL